MFIKSIKLNNFRNYGTFEHLFNKKITLFVGKNAQGKTNLLEAIYYLSALNSNRIKRDLELINFEHDLCKISAQIIKNDIDIELDVILEKNKNKILKVNGLKKTKSQEFLRVLKVVNFSNTDLMLLKGEPSNRRKWLDTAISQVYGAYYDKLLKYNKIRLQKSNFLTSNSCDTSLLDVFNTQMAISGANIIFLRRKYLKELDRIANLKHKTLSTDEDLKVIYECDLEDNLSINELSEKLYDKLCENKEAETRRAQCLIGPHRDDISYLINNIDGKKYGSQGQQRTIVLSLKLAELELIKEKINEHPILLLDDVLAELDNIRQNHLLEAISNNSQTVITNVDTLAFDEGFLSEVDIVKISKGEKID